MNTADTSFVSHVKNRTIHTCKAFFTWILVSPIQARIFLVIGLTFGLAFTFMSHPMQAPDETQHYWRSYEVSSLNFVAKRYDNGRYGYNLPDNVIVMGEKFLMMQHLGQTFDYGLRHKYFSEGPSKYIRPVYFENTAVYSPFGYLPQAFGIGISRLLNTSLLTGFYIARICNMLAWVILIFLALRIVPFGRWTFLLLSLWPMSIFEAASLSPDSMTIGICMLAVAYALYLYKQTRITKLQIAGIIAACIALGTLKQVYFLVGLAFLLVPARAFGSKRTRWTVLLGALAISALVAASWAVFAKGAADGIHTYFRIGAHIDTVSQAKYILLHPLHYIATVIYTVGYKYATNITLSLMGRLGWGVITLPAYCYVLIVVSFFVALLKDASLVTKTEWSRIKLPARWLGAVGALLALAVITILYLTFTIVGNHSVEGLQGRYFLPVMALLVVPLMYSVRNIHMQWRTRTFVTFILFNTVAVLVVSLASLYFVTYHQAWPV